MNGIVDNSGRSLLTVVLTSGDPSTQTEIDVWIDTGLTGDLDIPQSAIDKLDLARSGSIDAILADESQIELRTYSCAIKWFGSERNLEVIGNEGEYPLLGVGLLLLGETRRLTQTVGTTDQHEWTLIGPLGNLCSFVSICGSEIKSKGGDHREVSSLGRLLEGSPESRLGNWYRFRLYTKYEQVVWQVNWNSHSLRIVHLQWETGCGGDSRDWVIAESTEIAESFILDVERRTHAPGNAILVFTGGRWNRSESLYAATQSASFEDLVLADDLKATIRDDFARFLASEDRYDRLGISWRRGALLIGPPGNGKTHCVRALVKELAVSSLYVQSLSHQYYTAEQMWQQVFERARGLRPCVLVLEDLDSLVTDENRSFFLNQLDGFEQNHGLIVLATTNHPDRIDSAIIDRPSRFDRKYHFNLPTLDERRDYLSTWQQRLVDEAGWQGDEIEAIAAITKEFSFAYLKELVISTVMKWMHESDVSFVQVMESQAAILQRQMKTDSSEPPNRNGHPRPTRQRT